MATRRDPAHLQHLRDEAARLTRNATRKVARTRRANGADIAGTRYDPRRNLDKIQNYNTNQLNAYLREVGNFLDRKTQYYALGDETIITNKEWQRYARPEQTYRRRAKTQFDKVKNVKLPTGRTIEERFETVTPDRRRNRSARVNSVYDPPKRRPQDIANRKALQKLAKDMQKRVATDLETKQAALGQTIFHKMSNVVRDKKLDSMIGSLSPAQFRALWLYTSFADEVAQNYLVMKKMMQGDDDQKIEAGDNDEYDQQLERASELADWAKKLKLK